MTFGTVSREKSESNSVAYTHLTAPIALITLYSHLLMQRAKRNPAKQLTLPWPASSGVGETHGRQRLATQ